MNKKIDIVLVVDCSTSLLKQKECIETAVNDMVVSIKTNSELHGCDIYFSLIPFADKVIEDKCIKFKPVKTITEKISLGSFRYGTNPGPALKGITNDVIDRYHKWVEEDDLCFHPLIFFFTDGSPCPFDECQGDYEEAAKIIKDKEANKKLLIVGCAFGEGAYIKNMNLMTSYPERILKIKDNTAKTQEKLRRFFTYIIPQTTAFTVTGVSDQLPRVFKMFNDME